jgi:chromosome segregation ATPase
MSEKNDTSVDAINILLSQTYNDAGLGPLINERKAIAEKIKEGQDKIISLDETINRLTTQVDGLRTQSLDDGIKPPEAAKKINLLKNQIAEAMETKNLETSKQDKAKTEQQKVDDKILLAARIALGRVKARVSGIITDELIRLTNVPKNFNDAVLSTGVEIPGFLKISSDLKFMSYLTGRPSDVLII